MVGVDPSRNRRLRSAPDRKVRPLDRMVLVLLSAEDAAWMALVSRFRRRVEERPDT